MAIAPSRSRPAASCTCAPATTRISRVRYPSVVKALARLPDETVIDGEVVAFDEEGRPSFNALQNYGSAPAPVVYYVFDVMVLGGIDLRREPLEKRLALLEKKVLPKLAEPVRYTGALGCAVCRC